MFKGDDSKNLHYVNLVCPNVKYKVNNHQRKKGYIYHFHQYHTQYGLLTCKTFLINDDVQREMPHTHEIPI